MTDLFIQLTKDVMSRDDDGILIVMVIKEDKFQTRSHFLHVARGGGVVWWRKGGGEGCWCLEYLCAPLSCLPTVLSFYASPRLPKGSSLSFQVLLHCSLPTTPPPPPLSFTSPSPLRPEGCVSKTTAIYDTNSS